LPQPGYYNFVNPAQSYSNVGLAAKYGYTHGTILPSSGYLRVTVTDSAASVDYVRTYLPSDENSQRVNDAVAFSYSIRKPSGVTEVQAGQVAPQSFVQSQNYPNPFNPTTKIEIRVSKSEMVRLEVFDVLGRHVATLIDQFLGPGAYAVSFDAQKYTLPSGIYLSRLTAGAASETKKLILSK
jgi:hypothetical protein